jgi:archaellum biogenesis ATPase FlaH
MKGAILQSVELLKEGRFEEIQKTIEDSLKISTEQDLGADYFDSFKSRQQVHARACIPTGFPLLDANEVLDGGLANGELGVVMAPTGGGKSFFLVNLGYGALAAGKNVIHYSFELSETHVGNRYDSRITGIPTKELRNRMVEAEAQLVRFNGGQLYIKEYPPKVATINTIKFHMGRLLSNGFDPDLIIIDYGDLMKSRRGYDQKRFELESIFEDLRALSMEMKLPIWTATQSNREGFNDDVITIDKVGEAINKAMVVDFFGTFSQRKFHIGKNRMGQANVNYNIDMDPARAFIDLNDDQSTGFSVGDKVNNMLSGGDKMRSFYHDVKEEA